jgi:hypothetical protein
LWAIPIGRGWVMRRDAGVWVRVRLPEHLRPLRKTLEDVDVTPSGTAWVVGGIDRRGSKALVLEHGPTGWREHPTPSRRYPENLSAVDVSGEDQVAGAGYRIYGDHAYPYAVRLTSASFEYVPADNPGWLAFWDVALDQTGGAWAVGEYATDRSDGGIIERAC